MAKKRKDMHLNQIQTDDEYEKWVDRGILFDLRMNQEDIYDDFENYRPETLMNLHRERYFESNKHIYQFLDEDMVYLL